MLYIASIKLVQSCTVDSPSDSALACKGSIPDVTLVGPDVHTVPKDTRKDRGQQAIEEDVRKDGDSACCFDECRRAA